MSTFYREEENLWRRTNVQGMDQSLYLAALDVDLAVSDIYEDVEDLRV